MNTIFPHLSQTLYAGRGKLFAESSEFYPARCVSARRRRQNYIHEERLSGGQKDGSHTILIGNVGRMREKNFRIGTSEGKVMLSVFWVSEKILLVEFSERAATVDLE